uniref:NAD(P)H-quinone oxidoreductase subunit 2, chloroplastic n=1 Tax=Candidatus Methanophagaceae archaeon ANME-1 ERB6 TaxID=2759912 RepID=A0A7G9YZB5_9EURY|nr:NAD(P)H-quinone oxidoreductase subunit 2, chloroplastic [Methanosarcinales archaeon ANME-1 ERB6]
MMGLTLNVMDMGMLSALVILTLGSIGSFKNSKLGFYGAIIALVIAFSAIAVSAAHFISYGIFILAIAIINLVSLEAIKSEIKGVDYGLVGLMALATMYIFNTGDFALVLAALVLVSVPTYILVMIREGGANVEVGIKYITFMVLATVLFLIGAIILVYTKNAFDGSLYVLGYVMLVLGLCLEVGVAPLHEWVPDVFSSADPIPISIIASLAKIVPFIAALWILVYTSCDLTASITLFTAVIAAVSMFVGNIGALTSKELGRVLGYSTVAGMGYVLTCLVVVARPEYMYLALTGGLLMLFANAAGKIGFFNAIKGGGAYSPLMYILAFSFIGVPPLMGFWGKLFILLSLAKMEYFWLVAIVVINSAISIPYYIRLATELGVDWKPNLTNFICLAAVVMVLVTVFLLPVEWFYSTMEVIAQTVGIAI